MLAYHFVFHAIAHGIHIDLELIKISLTCEGDAKEDCTSCQAE